MGTQKDPQQIIDNNAVKAFKLMLPEESWSIFREEPDKVGFDFRIELGRVDG